MKVAFDEHIPPALFRVMDALVQEGDIEGIEFCRARDYSPGPKAKTDVPWVLAFVRDGGEVLISGERMMRSIPEVHAAIKESGVKAFYLPPKWNFWDMAMRTGFILVWWERIISQAALSEPGEAWMVPLAWGGGNFKKVKSRAEEI